MRAKNSWVAAALLLVAIGCNQSTVTPVEQGTDQVQQTPTTTDQDAATQGSQVYVYVINAHGARGLPTPGGDVAGAIAAAAGGEDESTLRTNGYWQSGFTINVNTGSTTPSLTGTTTGSATGTASPAQTASAYPIQDIKPETSASVPIGVAMPGGIVDQQATATGKGTSDVAKSNTNDVKWAQLRAAADSLGVGADALIKLLQGMIAPTSQPE